MMTFFSKRTTTTRTPTAAAAADDDTSSSEIVLTEVSGSHVLTIAGYSCTTRVGGNQYIRTATFSVAGHDWSLRYFPNGNSTTASHVSVFLLSGDADVSVRCTLTVLDGDGRPAHSRRIVGGSGKDKKSFTRMARNTLFGMPRFVRRDKAGQLTDDHDRLRLRCDITVLKLVRNGDAAAIADIAVVPAIDAAADVNNKFVDVPPSDIVHQLGNLLSGGDNGTADVVFEVAGETFRAHRSILAARSPVFRAELFSPAVMKEGNGSEISTCVVQDMDPRVFKAMLHFVYNDELPEIEEHQMTWMALLLIVAADRYRLERLRLICEEKLCGYIDMSSVGTILGYAEKYGCPGLRKACLSYFSCPVAI